MSRLFTCLPPTRCHTTYSKNSPHSSQSTTISSQVHHQVQCQSTSSRQNTHTSSNSWVVELISSPQDVPSRLDKFVYLQFSKKQSNTSTKKSNTCLASMLFCVTRHITFINLIKHHIHMKCFQFSKYCIIIIHIQSIHQHTHSFLHSHISLSDVHLPPHYTWELLHHRT